MSCMKVVIIGAGPAGLFAALELCEHQDVEIIIVDKGPSVEERVKTNEVLCGVGGAGGLSDGTLNLAYENVGGDLTRFTSRANAAQLIEQVDSVFLSHGGSDKLWGIEGSEPLVKRARQAGVIFIPVKQRHMGSDNLPSIITSIQKYLESKGVKFLLNQKVSTIENNTVKTDKGEIVADKIIICAGRSGAHWLADYAKAQGIDSQHAPIDVGVRVEVPDNVMEDVIAINHDPKFHIITKKHDDFMRTFCTNPSGFIATEKYSEFIAVNGHSMTSKKSGNTNFALLHNISLTEPLEDTIAYGREIARIATTLGGGKPLLQRMRDLRNGKRSNWERIKKSYISPTLTEVTPGDIAMALPSRTVTNILEALDKLDKVIPGVADDSTLLYAPEIKFYSMQFKVDENMMTNKKDLFVAGDGAGLTRGISTAAATGILAARGVLNTT